jgi:hypothetical protein
MILYRSFREDQAERPTAEGTWATALYTAAAENRQQHQ